MVIVEVITWCDGVFGGWDEERVRLCKRNWNINVPSLFLVYRSSNVLDGKCDAIGQQILIYDCHISRYFRDSKR